MFRFFLFFAIILIIFVIYNTYFNNKAKHRYIDNDKKFTAIIYTKDNCPYCFKAKNLFEKMNIKYQEISLNQDTHSHQKLIVQTGQTTVPYIFINEEFVGGHSDLLELKNQGKFSN